MRAVQSLSILILLLANLTTGQALAEDRRAYEHRLGINLINLESAELVGEALRENLHDTLRSILQQYLADHKPELEQLLADSLGSEFKHIDVMAGQLEKGRSVSFPEKDDALNVGITVSQVGTGGDSATLTRNANIYLQMLFRPAAPLGKLNNFDQQFLEALRKGLPEYSREYFKKRLETSKARTEQLLGESQKTHDALVAQLDKLRRDKGLDEGLSASKAAERLAEIDRQLLTARLSEAGLAARERAIIEHIDRLEKVDLSDSDKALLANLQKIYELRQENLKRLKAVEGTGTVNVAEQLQKAETDVLAAKMEYEKARATARGAERQAVLNVELTKVAIDKAEATARLEYLEKARKEVTENIRLQQEAAKIRKDLENAANYVEFYAAGLKRLKSAPEKIDPVEVNTGQGAASRGRG